VSSARAPAVDILAVDETSLISGFCVFVGSLDFSFFEGADLAGEGDLRLFIGGCAVSSSEELDAEEASSASSFSSSVSYFDGPFCGLIGFSRLYSNVVSSISNSGFVKASLNRSSSKSVESLRF
jgi:hypothetical protein